MENLRFWIVQDEAAVATDIARLNIDDEMGLYLLRKERGDAMILKYDEARKGQGVEKFQGFISGAMHVQRALQAIGVPPNEAELMRFKMQEGTLYLYTDRGELNHYYQYDSEFLDAGRAITEPIDNTFDLNPTPNARVDAKREYPIEGEQRINLDGQNIRRPGDIVVDPAAEEGFPSDYYKMGQDDEYKNRQE